MMVSNLSPKNSQESITSLLRWIYKFISKKNKINFLKSLFLIISCGFSEIISLATVIPFLNMVTDPEMVNNYEFLMNLMKFTNFQRPLVISGSLLIFANLINLFLRLLNVYKINQVASQIGNELSFNLFSNTINQPYNYHLSIKSSVIIDAVTRDIPKIILDI